MKSEARRVAQEAAAEELRASMHQHGVTLADLGDALDVHLSHIDHLRSRSNATTLTVADLALLADADVACREVGVRALHTLALRYGYGLEAVESAATEPVLAAAELAAQSGAFVRDVAAKSAGGLDERERRELRSSMDALAAHVNRVRASLSPRLAVVKARTA